MNLRTKRLEIRPIEPLDRDFVLDLLTDETVGKTYMLPAFKSREEAEALFLRLVQLSHDETRFVAGVYLDDRFIGMMNETESRKPQIEMGYAYLPAFYNQGYATEAFAEAIKYMFSCGFTRIVAGAFEENPASIRVMEKCGMTRQPQLDQIEYRGKLHNCVYYAIDK